MDFCEELTCIAFLLKKSQLTTDSLEIKDEVSSSTQQKLTAVMQIQAPVFITDFINTNKSHIFENSGDATGLQSMIESIKQRKTTIKSTVKAGKEDIWDKQYKDCFATDWGKVLMGNG